MARGIESTTHTQARVIHMEETALVYDLLVQNGYMVDSSGMPLCVGDVTVRNGKIIKVGKLSGQATHHMVLRGWCRGASPMTSQP